MADFNSSEAFYKSPITVARYEEGRSNRVFVRHLPRLLRLLPSCERPVVLPLPTIFDWIYNTRLAMLTDNMLTTPILDIACGTSYFYRSLIAEGWKGRVSGFDSSRSMIEAGSTALDHMSAYTEPNYSQDKNIFFYKDALGRKTVDVAPPANIIDTESLLHLRHDRTVRSVESQFTEVVSTVTAFSGPFCFFPHNIQYALLRKLSAHAEQNMALQFKNSAFLNMNQSSEVLQKIASVIRYIFENDISDSYMFLHGIDFARQLKMPPLAPTSTQHESGKFDYYLSPVETIRSWLDELGFKVVKIGTMGFMSETFYALARDYYGTRMHGQSLESFIHALIGIDEYFCMVLLMGDNIHISATRQRSVPMQSTDFLFIKTYRTDYEAEPTANIDYRWL